MRFASATTVSQAPSARAVIAGFYPQGDPHPRGSCSYAEMWPPFNRVLTDTPKRAVHLHNRDGPRGVFVENVRDDEWKGLPPHCNGRQGWSLPSPPLCSHTFGCRHRCCDSDRFAWNEPFRFLGGGGGGRLRTGERGCGEAPHRSCSGSNSSESAGSPSAIPARQQRASMGKYTGVQAPVSAVCGGMDAAVSSARHRFGIS